MTWGRLAASAGLVATAAGAILGILASAANGWPTGVSPVVYGGLGLVFAGVGWLIVDRRTATPWARSCSRSASVSPSTSRSTSTSALPEPPPGAALLALTIQALDVPVVHADGGGRPALPGWTTAVGALAAPPLDRGPPDRRLDRRAGPRRRADRPVPRVPQPHRDHWVPRHGPRLRGLFGDARPPPRPRAHRSSSAGDGGTSSSGPRSSGSPRHRSQRSPSSSSMSRPSTRTTRTVPSPSPPPSPSRSSRSPSGSPSCATGSTRSTGSSVGRSRTPA